MELNFIIGPYIRGMSIDLARLPPDLRSAATRELRPDEKVLYAGRPDWRSEWGKLIAIFLFGLGWSAISFTMFGVAAAAAFGLIPDSTGKGLSVSGWPMLFIVVLLPFVGIGVLLLAAPFIEIVKSARTVHLVTDLRLLSVTAGKRSEAASVSLAAVNFIKRRDGSARSGTLSIGYGVEKDSDGDPRPLEQSWSGIPDARRAEAAIRDHAKWAR